MGRSSKKRPPQISTEDLSAYIEAIDNLPENFISFKMKTIGRFIDRYDPVILITWLRATFMRRNHIQYWNEFLVLVKNDLKRRKLDPETILKGLEEAHFKG